MQRRNRPWFVLGVLLALSGTAWGQTVNGAITGVVKDSSGGVVPDVALTLRNVATDQIVGTTVSGSGRRVPFRNLAPRKYEVQATKEGFQQVTIPTSTSPSVRRQRVEMTLPVGTQEQRIEVLGGSSVLATTQTQEHGISPETLQQLPLLMNSGPRAAAAFATLMPGVSTGGDYNAFDARINGGLQSGDEASRRRRQHAAGLHESGRHGLDLPGLPDVARHGQRSQGPDVELRARVRVVDWRPDHGRDEVRRQLVPRRRRSNFIATTR